MNAALSFTQAIHLKGEFEGRRSAVLTQTHAEGPPDPGSVHTSKTRNPQILYVCLDALNPRLCRGARIATAQLVTEKSQMGSISSNLG